MKNFRIDRSFGVVKEIPASIRKEDKFFMKNLFYGQWLNIKTEQR
jgi:hypothetical protein